MADANELLQQARTYLEQGELSNAEQTYREVLKADPRSAEALAELGRFAMAREKIDEGLRLVEQALDVDPKFAQALAYKGLAYSMKEDFERATPLFEEAVKQDPAMTMAWHNLARAYRKLGHWEKAEKAVREAINLDPKHFQSHYELSTILANTGRTTEAIRAALLSIEINPYFIKGYMTLGKAYELGGKGDLALRLYHEGLKHIPSAVILREEVIRLSLMKRDMKTAYVEMAILTKQNNNYDNNMRLGNLAILAGDFEGAEKAFKRAAQIRPDMGDPHFNLGEIYQSAKLKDEAIAEYEKAIALDANEWKAYNSLGVLFMKDETPESLKKAAGYFQETLARNTRAPEPYYNLALIYGKSGSKAEAKKYAQMALERIPTDGVLKQDVERLIRALTEH
ncbi:MAG: tetratricopeptide repeat protein [Acidobacteria bacterium]|nr:tetratricopeptide repeat protein [Acidobacteriota bacterium]